MAKSRIKRKKPTNKLFPTPALLPGLRGGADWHVTSSGETATGSTVNLHGNRAEMVVPEGDDSTAKWTRLHELLHAAHSPLEQPRDITKTDGTVVSRHALLMAEEIRVDSIGRTMAGKSALPDDLSSRMTAFLTPTATLYAKTGKAETANEIISMALAAWAQHENHMGSEHFMAKEIRGLAYTWEGNSERSRLLDLATLVDHAFNRIFYKVWEVEFEQLFEMHQFPDWNAVIELGQFIDTVFKTADKLSKTPTPTAVDPDLAKLGKIIDDATADKQPQTLRMLDEELEKQGFKPEVTTAPKDEEVRWGDMKVTRPRRPMRLPKTKSSRSKYSATDAGASPRYIHRLLTDGQVFARKKRVPGGSVLIDDSGSMSWSNKEVQEIVESAPAVDIAAYSGSGAQGELVIISEDGTWCDAVDNRPSGGGNVVDMPALEWLATKKEPRIWVSDQLVVPAQGTMAKAAVEVLAFVQANNINVVETAEEAGQVFAGKKAIYR